MKKLKISIASLLVAASALVGCDNAEYGTLGTHAYINESVSSLSRSTKVVLDSEEGANVQITVYLSSKSEADAQFRLVVDEAVLKSYNEAQSASYTVMPEELFELPESITISEGKFNADPVSIHINQIPADMAGEMYAIPLRLESIDGKIPTTSASSTFVITIESIAVSTLPMFDGGAGLATQEGFPMSLDKFTVEVRFQISDTANRNRAVFTNGGSNGSLVLLRFEDPQNDETNDAGEVVTAAHSLVQFQGDNGFLNPTTAFVPNKWQHLAVTYDGTKITIYVNGAFAGSKDLVVKSEFKQAGWFGGSVPGGDGGHGTDDSWWNGCKILCTEARIWSVCRTEAQIQNNMTTVSPSSEGLEAYWRFNEGSGTTFEDCTGHGHTLTTTKSPTWIPGIKSNDPSTPWPGESK